MLDGPFFRAIAGKRNIALLNCPICERQLFLNSASENQSIGIRCQPCGISYDVVRLENTIRFLPRTGSIETLADFNRLLENNTVELPGCPKCGKDELHTYGGEMKCCDLLWMPSVTEGNIVYDVQSLTATHPFENPIPSIDRDAYTHSIAMFAAEHVGDRSEDNRQSNVSGGLREVHAGSVATSQEESSYHTGVKELILTYLSQYRNPAKRNEIVQFIKERTGRESYSRFTPAANELIDDGKIRKVRQGVYELISRYPYFINLP